MASQPPSDQASDPYPGSPHQPGDDGPGTLPASGEEDGRSDIEQAVEARCDAVARGEGGPEPDPMTAPGDYAGNAGTGGEVKNQDLDAQ